jgi:hypothetical protein
MPVNSLPVSDLLTAELATAGKQFVSIIAKACAPASLLAWLRDELAGHVARLEERINAKLQNRYNPKLHEADELRDQQYTNMVRYVEGALRHPDPQKALAARQLHALFAKQDPGLTRKSYAVESGKLNALLSDLKAAALQEPARLLELEQPVKDLEVTQKSFEELFGARVSTNVENDLQELSTYTSPLRQSISETLVHLNTIERREPDVYGPIVKEVNALNAEYIAKINARETRKASGADKAAPGAGGPVSK